MRKINISIIYIIIASLLLSGATSWIILNVLTPIYNAYYDYTNLFINNNTIDVLKVILVPMVLVVFVKNTPKLYDLTILFLIFIYELLTTIHHNKLEVVDFILITMIFISSLLILEKHVNRLPTKE